MLLASSYRAIISNENLLFLRHQVNYFAIATNDFLLLYTHICDALQSKLLVPMKHEG